MIARRVAVAVSATSRVMTVTIVTIVTITVYHIAYSKAFMLYHLPCQHIHRQGSRRGRL